MSAAVADASFLVALVSPSDSHRHQAIQRIEESGPPMICDVTLSELMQVAFYRMQKTHGAAAGHAAARQALRIAVDQLGCRLEPMPPTVDSRRFFEKHLRLSWADCVVLAQALGRDLWTFDEHQEAIHARR